MNKKTLLGLGLAAFWLLKPKEQPKKNTRVIYVDSMDSATTHTATTGPKNPVGTNSMTSL